MHHATQTAQRRGVYSVGYASDMQVRNARRVARRAAHRGHLRVHIGAMLARWSNDHYRSTRTGIGCLEGCHDAGNPLKYPRTICAE